MEYDIKTIPHNEQRYETVGDFWTKDGVDFIRVSEMEDPRYNFLVALHEFIEQELCKVRGIKTEDIDKFDQDFKGEGEPGDSPLAIYRREHFFATSLERLMAAELGVDWEEYDDKVNSL